MTRQKRFAMIRLLIAALMLFGTYQSYGQEWLPKQYTDVFSDDTSTEEIVEENRWYKMGEVFQYDPADTYVSYVDLLRETRSILEEAGSSFDKPSVNEDVFIEYMKNTAPYDYLVSTPSLLLDYKLGNARIKRAWLVDEYVIFLEVGEPTSWVLYILPKEIFEDGQESE